jgi:hypothetical protein
MVIPYVRISRVKAQNTNSGFPLMRLEYKDAWSSDWGDL